MALNWNWSEKCGEAVFEQRGKEYTMNLYQGNAYLIFIYEFTEDENNMYNVWSFWVDKGHAKRCLGLEKNPDGDKRNIYNGTDKLKKVRLNKAKCNRFAELVGLFAKAFDELVIEIYTE